MRCGGAAPNLGSVCSACRTAHSSLDQLHAAVIFEGPIRPAVHALKYQGKFGLGAPLASLMADVWSGEVEFDVVMPVPLHAARQSDRGYNQSEKLAAPFAARIGKPLVVDALFRTRDTRRQVGLNERQRTKNVLNAFEAVSEHVADQRVLLIDDVCTTGSTLVASADALMRAGARGVSAYCLARAIDPRAHHYDNVGSASAAG